MEVNHRTQVDVSPRHSMSLVHDKSVSNMREKHERHDSLMEEAGLLGHDLKLEPARKSHKSVPPKMYRRATSSDLQAF